MIEQLFGSKTRAKLLKLFYNNPNRSFYVREITRKVEEQINSVRRELANLLSLGLITSDSTNNKLYYEVDQSYEHYDALRSMFAGQKMPADDHKAPDTEEKPAATKASTGKKSAKDTPKKSEEPKAKKVTADDGAVQSPEAKRWSKAGNVIGVAYSGVYTRDESAGIDIVVVGDVVASSVDSVIAELEKEKNIELRYAVMEQSEWDYRKQINDKFWLQFDAAKKQVVLDKGDVFTKS